MVYYTFISAVMVWHSFLLRIVCTEIVVTAIISRLRRPCNPAAYGSDLHAGNMVLFNKDGLIQKYNSPEEILSEFFDLRMTYYYKRREFLIQARLFSLCKRTLLYGALPSLHELQIGC